LQPPMPPAPPQHPQPHSAPASPSPPSPPSPPLPPLPPAPPAVPVAQAVSAAPAVTGGPGGPTVSGMSATPDHPVRHDPPGGQPHPAAGGDFVLAAPDPRAAAQAAARATDPSPGTGACVACRAGRVDRDGYCEHCGHAQPRPRDHMEQELDSVAAVTDRGLRHHRNEDAFAVSAAALGDGSPAVVAVVCDGVSSAARPDEASAAASDTANACLTRALADGAPPRQALHDAIMAAGDAVTALAGRDGDGAGHDPDTQRHRNAPACTLVAAVAAGGRLAVGWVGDSRVYWVPDDRTAAPCRLTEDDSWAAQMVAAGLMTEAQAYADERAHAITGWLGADAYELEPHTAVFAPDRPGVVVVCTDGLWNYAESAEDMARAVPPDAARRPLHAARVLVGHALDGGGHDNVTVAVLPFAVPPQGAGAA
ncbi:PP2C family serine/threonine-protein phosphatase, partial [Streptomyces sp. CC77]|uniref:PP2C family protein-serine/threonine phosphatase n=1 Tax=Streptomyces sp. CC77 TaxID=1906739 RepID=UPI000D19B986